MSEVLPAVREAGSVQLFGEQGIALTEHAAMTRVGLYVSEGATQEELAALAEGLGVINDAACFAVGDISNFMREHFPAEWRVWVDQPSPIKGLDNKTVKVYGAVAAAFSHETRVRYMTAYDGRYAVSFSHFSRVRRYGKEQAEFWLEQAATYGWSLDEMAERLDGSTVALDKAPMLPQGTPDSVFGAAYWLGPPHDPGRHLLVCGDATVPEYLALLTHMGGSRKAAMVWTDPPYGVEYVGKTEDALTIQNDEGGDVLYRLLLAAWRAATPVLDESTPFYVTGPSGNNMVEFLRSFADAGWRFQQLLIWEKNRMIMGHNHYHYKHESVFYGFSAGRRTNRLQYHASEGKMDEAIASGEGIRRWYGDNNAISIFYADSPSASREHPTMKPVKLIVPALENSSQPGDIVLDPFAGSGSTLIACDQTGRRCFAVEYDPAYADVIRRRYAEYLRDQETGLVAQAAEETPSYVPGPLDGE